MQFYTPTDIINIPTDIVDPKSKGKEIFLTIERSYKIPEKLLEIP